jgi:hypothetical protein
VIENCKGNTNGLGLKNQGKEQSVEDLGEYDEKLIKKVSSTREASIPDGDFFADHWRRSTRWFGSTL